MDKLINEHCEIKENEGNMMRVEVPVGEMTFDAIEALKINYSSEENGKDHVDVETYCANIS